MSVQFPEKLDPWRAARLGQRFDSQLETWDFSRIPMPGQVLEPVQVRLVFSLIDFGRAKVELDFRVQMASLCQRCMEPMRWSQTVARTLLLMAPRTNPSETTGTIEAQLHGNLEVIPLAHGELLQLIDLIEDELLLALPFAPTHEHCEPLIAEPETIFERKDNPFAELVHLKTRKPSK